MRTRRRLRVRIDGDVRDAAADAADAEDVRASHATATTTWARVGGVGQAARSFLRAARDARDARGMKCGDDATRCDVKMGVGVRVCDAREMTDGETRASRVGFRGSIVWKMRKVRISRYRARRRRERALEEEEEEANFMRREDARV
jgi:hypothetical protein